MKFISHVLQANATKLSSVTTDVLLASYVLNSVATKHELNDIAKKYLNVTLPDFSDLLGKGRNKLTLANYLLKNGFRE